MHNFFKEKQEKQKKTYLPYKIIPQKMSANLVILGVDISASGSLKASMDTLCTKANKAKYALNNINRRFC